MFSYWGANRWRLRTNRISYHFTSSEKDLTILNKFQLILLRDVCLCVCYGAQDGIYYGRVMRNH